MALLYSPYVWGGDDFSGWDCSGLAQELLKVGGGHPAPQKDFTAQMLYDYFRQPANHMAQEPELGALVFYGDPTRVEHVAVCLSKRLMIEAGGGGSKVTSVAEAIKANAYVRIRPIRFDRLLGFFLPDYPAL